MKSLVLLAATIVAAVTAFAIVGADKNHSTIIQAAPIANSTKKAPAANESRSAVPAILSPYLARAKAVVECLGRTNQEVIDRLGQPSRTDEYAGNPYWCWDVHGPPNGPSGASIRVLFDQTKRAKLVVLYHSCGASESVEAYWERLFGPISQFSIEAYYESSQVDTAEYAKGGFLYKTALLSQIRGQDIRLLSYSQTPAVAVSEAVDLSTNKMVKKVGLNPSFDWRKSQVMTVFVGKGKLFDGETSGDFDRSSWIPLPK